MAPLWLPHHILPAEVSLSLPSKAKPSGGPSLPSSLPRTDVPGFSCPLLALLQRGLVASLPFQHTHTQMCWPLVAPIHSAHLHWVAFTESLSVPFLLATDSEMYGLFWINSAVSPHPLGHRPGCPGPCASGAHIPVHPVTFAVCWREEGLR